MDNQDIIIGTNIRLYRKKLRISQRILAQRVGISFQYLSVLERGERSAKKFLPKIAEILKISLEELTGDQKKDNPPLLLEEFLDKIDKRFGKMEELVNKLLIVKEEEKQKLPQEGQAPASKTAKSI